MARQLTGGSAAREFPTVKWTLDGVAEAEDSDGGRAHRSRRWTEVVVLDRKRKGMRGKMRKDSGK